MSITPKISLHSLTDKKNNWASASKNVFSKEQKKYLPDNYYTYDIHRHLKTDFHNISPEKDMHINICCFMVIESRPTKIIEQPFLEYLLYKYPKSTDKVSNLCVFPFVKYKNGEILDICKKMIKTLFDKIYSPLGYIQNQDGIFLFYNIEFISILVRSKTLTKKPHYVWGLIDEICNHKKYITFPIHKSVTELFLKNPKLIYLKNKNKMCIEVPTVAFVGESHELLNYIATLGIKSSTVRRFGPYYYFGDFKSQIRRGGWTSNYEKRHIFNKSITDENGKYLQGGLVRFAIFLGNYRVVLDRKSDPMTPYVEAYDNVKQPSKKLLAQIRKGKGNWTKTYDALVISNLKNNRRSGFFWANTGFIVKKFNFFTSLSIHLIDKSTLKPNWDIDSEFYDIK